MNILKYSLIFVIFITNIFSENVFSYYKIDNENFYQKQNGEKFLYVLIIGGLMANTSVDQSLRDLYQDKIRNENTNFISKTTKLFGEGDIMIPLMATLSGFGSVLKNDELKDFGTNTLRAYLVGAPSMLLMQKITGGSRPDEISNASKWKFFKDENGVSGHAFMGSIPFLVLAKSTNNEYFSNFFKGISISTALSRINDDAHFPSQTLLGWYMGNIAVESVFNSNYSSSSDKNDFILNLLGNALGFSFIQKISSKAWNDKKILVVPIIDSDKYGIYISKQF